MRVALLVFNPIGKGTYWQAFHLARCLVAGGHQITLVAMASVRGARFSVCSEQGVTIVAAPDLLWGALRSGWDPYSALVRALWLLPHRYDIVHAFECRPTVLLPALLAGRPPARLIMDWCDWFGAGGSVEERPNPLIRTVLRPVETVFAERFRTLGAEMTMHIPQMRPWLGEEEQRAAAQVLADGWISEGPRAAALAERLNALIDVPYGVFAPNGTLALYLALLAAGVGPGDEVIVPDITFIASANAVLFAGATPVFADVEPETFQIDPAACAAAITPRTRAIMPVQLFGMAAEMDELLNLAGAHNLLVIEDAAQGIGVRYRGRHVGGIGDLGCFSFFSDKTITMGEGGYVACRDAALYERLQFLRNQGRIKRGSFIHPEVGTNLRITDIQAAVGLAQLDRLDQIVARKRAILNWYAEGLRGIAGVRLLVPPAHVDAVPFRAVLIAERADTLMAHLEARGVQPRGFFYPLHRQPCFAHLGRDRGGPLDLADANFPGALYGAAHGVLLPAYPELGADEVRYICRTVRECSGG
jgi:perosamine synthetase